MDHIELPRDRDALDVTIPYLAKESDQYDGLGIDTFPARRGYVNTDGHLSLHTSTAQSTLDCLAFVQAWLYFGLLHEALGPLFCQDDFLVHTHERSYLSTAKLKDILERRRAQSLSFRSPWRVLTAFPWLGTHATSKIAPDSVNSIVTEERQRISAAIALTIRQCDFFDRKMRDDRWAAVLLSIRILAEAVHSALCECRLSNGQQLPLSQDLYPHYCSLRLIKTHMLRRTSGWCSHHFNMLVRNLSCTTLFYLANLQRRIPAWIDHGACLRENQCIAYNSNREFQAIHTHQNCNCNHIQAPVQDMHKILEHGGIPVLKSSRASANQPPSLSFVSAAPGSFYGAVSHLWADGLGNQVTNSLPLCQVRRLHETVSSYNYAVAKYAPLLDRPKKKRSLLLRWPILLFRDLFKQRYVPSDNRNVVYYWLDVYCVPVAAEDLPSHEKIRLQMLKSIALSRMTMTYSWANYVLVFDHEIATLTANHSYHEFLGRAAISGWNSRFWTYQEYCMARTLVFYGGGGPIGTHTIGVDGSGGWPLFGLKPLRTRSSVLSQFTDLSKLLCRPQFATGMRIGETLAYGQEQRLKNFVHLWNLLQDKNTTKPGDELLIFGMLMDLSSGELENIRPRGDRRTDRQPATIAGARMKAILKTFQFLPLGILFLRSSQPLHPARGSRILEDDRWVPRALMGAGYLGNPENQVMELTDLGLRIPSQILFNVQNARLLILQAVYLGGLECTFVLDTNTFKVRFNEIGDCSNVQARSTRAILLLDMPTGKQCGRGAYLVDAEFLEGVTRTSYAGPISWTMCERSHEHVQPEQRTCEANVLTAASIGDLFINCDTRGWPRLKLRRDLLHQQRRSLKKTFRRTEIASRLLLFVLFVILIGVIGNYDSSGNAQVGFFYLILVVFVTVLYVVATMRSMYNRTVDYISMEQLSPNADPEDRWWESLEKAIPGMRQNIVPTPMYFQWQMKVTLRIAVGLAKLFSKKDRVRSRNGRVTELV